ncbi:5-deoxy-glucuronate isomerase [Aeromicrobium phragmitis]|uniref:5-deoxy-glucuronate isomerase n=1 Tax=Aeromicrobium phragmitis TaxID=2478914 RepID=A0A3L8PMC4_9ACTN|nr:5-deoxy-glucuronate isomerase [Aeromicrobium phragmitis]RLV55172.1 5-deoxy-glucuronate isomerase [Aeromicrobium phragmitis]
MTSTQHLVRAGSTSHGATELTVTPETARWDHSGLLVVSVAAGQTIDHRLEDDEAMVLSLSGSATVTVDDERFELVGRRDVFAGPSDVVYAGRGATLTITSDAGGRFAIATARCERRLPTAYLPAERVPVELRGAGQASRQVHNFGVPGVLDADRMIACEVITPGGNWSSYPPHKHDEERDGAETRLEEIYYFEVADGPAGPGMAYQRVYGHERSTTDILAEVRTGDVVLIPDGWHGPSMAVPGYDLYYLNVMAGPGPVRAWLICDDPAHAWVRGTWEDQPIDPRLPLHEQERTS